MKENILYLLIALIAIIVIVVIITILKKKKGISQEESNMLIDALGGRSNIKSYEERVSRINVYVFDNKLVDSEKIKDISNCGVVVVDNKVQIILKNNVKVFHDMLSDL